MQLWCVENIYRYIEEGEKPCAAAMKGAGEIGFTVFSISLSLVAVFIPLLLMEGIIGRLMREFALTVTVTIAVSVVVSLTLTPMLCSRFLRPRSTTRAWLNRKIGAFFDALVGRIRADAQHRASQPLHHADDFLRDAGLTIVLFLYIPKGFFPVQDTGILFGGNGRASGYRLSGNGEAAAALADIIAKDPDVEPFGIVLGPRPGYTHKLRPSVSSR